MAGPTGADHGRDPPKVNVPAYREIHQWDDEETT